MTKQTDGKTKKKMQSLYVSHKTQNIYDLAIRSQFVIPWGSQEVLGHHDL